MFKGREVVLRVVNLNLTAGHRITRILDVLKIPRSTYYGYLKWQPSETAIRRQFIKEKTLEYWLKYPMYGYPRLTILLNQELHLGVSRYLIYQLMQELGIQSRMIKNWKRPKSKGAVEQRPNLIKELTNKTAVLLTNITYIPVKSKWVYLASLYCPETRRVLSHKIGANMTKELATSVIKQPLIKAAGTKIIHSDMGSQYTSELFEETLRNQGIQHSYSRKVALATMHELKVSTQF